MRTKVLSVTQECCHYLQNCQGNGVALLRQINANFQVPITFLIIYYEMLISFFILRPRLICLPHVVNVLSSFVRAFRVIGSTVAVIGSGFASL